MGYFIFFFIFIVAGISFLRERISGTLERILATPLKRSEIVLGYFLGFGLFVAAQTVLLQVFIIYVLDVPMEGSFLSILFLNLLLATVALSLGLFLSAYAGNEFQLFQFIPLVIVPQALFSGIFDLSESPRWVELLSKIFPLTYAAGPLGDIMLRGASMKDVLQEILILLGFALVFLYLNTLALKKYRKA
jgi:ABC-2 type transport system permease protein